MTNPPDPTLGELLQARIDQDAADKLARLTRQTKELSEKARAELQEVTDFFESARKQFTDAILDSRPLPPLVLGKRQNTSLCSILCTYRWNDPASRLDNKSHHYFPVWGKFAEWCTDNGLIAKILYEHDGVGIESWNVITVVPKSLR